MTRYAQDGRLAIDNNLAERLFRGVVISRKNLLFVGSDKGGERAAILYTLIETAKLNGLGPEAYFARAIDRLAWTAQTTSTVGVGLRFRYINPAFACDDAPWRCSVVARAGPL